MNNPCISIIVPVYNEENNISTCISSIQKQTYKDIEIIIIDDGSTDGSYEICRKIADTDNRIILIHKENEGQGIARNLGIKISKGKYIGFVDADDYIDTQMYSSLYQKAQQDEAECCAMVAMPEDRLFHHKDTFADAEIRQDIIPALITARDKDSQESIIGVSCYCKIYRSDILHKNEIFFDSEAKFFSEDYLFNLKFLLVCKKFSVIKKMYYHYVMRENSYTHRYQESYFLKAKEMYIYTLELLGDPYKFYLQKKFIDNLRTCLKNEIYYSNKSVKIILKQIKVMVCDDLVCNIMNNFPIHNLNIYKRIICILIKRKYSHLLLLCFYIQSLIKGK